MFSTRLFIIVLCFLMGNITGIWAAPSTSEISNSTTPTSSTYRNSTKVGMDGSLSIELLPPEVFAKRQDPTSDIFVTISPDEHPDTTTPGDTIHYTVTYTALAPGSYNLSDSLIRMGADGHPVPIKDSIQINITSSLPADHDGALIPAKARPYHFFTSYNLLITSVSLVWVALLIPLIFWGREPRMTEEVKEEKKQPSIEEILQPLLQEAHDNQLDNAGKAKLESAVFIQLRTQLKMDDASPHEMILALKENPKTASAIEILESWLHRPHTPTTPNKLSIKDHQELVTTTLHLPTESQTTENH